MKRWKFDEDHHVERKRVESRFLRKSAFKRRKNISYPHDWFRGSTLRLQALAFWKRSSVFSYSPFWESTIIMFLSIAATANASEYFGAWTHVHKFILIWHIGDLSVIIQEIGLAWGLSLRISWSSWWFFLKLFVVVRTVWFGTITWPTQTDL